MTKRTEQQWTALFDATVTSIIEGRCANSYYGDFSLDSIISEAISGADLLVKQLKEREESENWGVHQETFWTTRPIHLTSETPWKKTRCFEKETIGDQDGQRDWWTSNEQDTGTTRVPTIYSWKLMHNNCTAYRLFRYLCKKSLKVLPVKIWGKNLVLVP